MFIFKIVHGKIQSYVSINDLGEESYQAFKEDDIGDIIGARENITGIEAWQPVKKKIVTIENENDIKVEYEV